MVSILRTLGLALGLLVLATAAQADCTGQVPVGYFCGNGKGSSASFTGTLPSTMFDAAFSATPGVLLGRTNAGWVASAIMPSGLTIPSPTISGTMTGPDSGTWGSGGINGSIIGATTPEAGHFTTESLTGALTYGGVTLSNSVTGTGSMVLSTSPALTTPNLGTPSAVTLTNATGLPIASGVSGLGSGVAAALAVGADVNGGFAVYGTAVTTVNGTSCVVGGSCSIPLGAFTPGTTTISGASPPCVLVNSTGTTSACIDLTNSYLAAGTFSNITGLGTVGIGMWQATAIGAAYGGTGANESSATGVGQWLSGTYSVSTALANGTTATTQSPGDNTTKVATDAFVFAATPTCSASTLGLCKPDGTTITASGGVLTAVGSAATSIDTSGPTGGTTVISGAANAIPFMTNSGGTNYMNASSNFTYDTNTVTITHNGASTVPLVLNTPGAGEYSYINIRDNGTPYWSFGKDNSQNFYLYDYAKGNFSFDFATNGGGGTVNPPMQFNADVFFKTRPWVDVCTYIGEANCGNASVDSHIAINSATVAAENNTLYWPAGGYCTTQTLTFQSSIERWLGAGFQVAYINGLGCGGSPGTFHVVELNGAYDDIGFMSINGATMAAVGNVPTLNDDIVVTNHDDTIHDVLLTGGVHGIEVTSTASDCYGHEIEGYESYQSEVYFNLGECVLYGRNKFDFPTGSGSWPNGWPGRGSIIGTWTASTPYSTSNCGSNTCLVAVSNFLGSGLTALFQVVACSSSCHSGGSSPFSSSSDYGVNVTDNQVTWQLASMEQPCVEFNGVGGLVQNTDCTGPYDYAAYIHNGAVQPALFAINAGNVINAGVDIEGATTSTVNIDNGYFTNCTAVGCSGIVAQNSFAGGLTVRGTEIYADYYGINVQNGINIIIQGNLIYNAATAGINFQSNSVGHFVVSGNVVGGFGGGEPASAIGLQIGSAVQQGTYRYDNNDFSGSTVPVSDSGIAGTAITLSDASGGGISISSQTANYVRDGSFIDLYAAVQYGSNSNPNTNALGTLPYPVGVGLNYNRQCVLTFTSTANISLALAGAISSTSVSFTNSSGNAVPNSSLSNAVVIFHCRYAVN